jgi:hypothetical protein
MSRATSASNVAGPSTSEITVVIDGGSEIAPENANELAFQEELRHTRQSQLTQLISLVGKIHRMSQQLFPGPVTVDYASDPEDCTNEYIVFDVVARGEFADYRDLIFQWHDEVEKLVPDVLSEFRLIVHPRP